MGDFLSIRRPNGFHLILLITTSTLLILLISQSEWSPSTRLSIADIPALERICASAGKSTNSEHVLADGGGNGGDGQPVVPTPEPNPEREPDPDAEQKVGMRIGDLTRRWSKHETRFIRGLPGFMMFENLYLHNGTFYAITSLPPSLPSPSQILCDPPIPKPEYDEHPAASSQRWQVITPAQADELFLSLANGNKGSKGRDGSKEKEGNKGKKGMKVKAAGVLSGTTFFFNDGPGKRGLLGHYFHFVAESFLGAWRVHTSSDLALHKNTASDVVFPTRVIMPRGDDWRDSNVGLNAWFLNTVLPNTAIEDIYQWEDRAKSNAIHVFSSIIIIDRWTAHKVPGSEADVWNKMTADIMATPAPTDWFQPLRTSLMQRLGIVDYHAEKAKDKPVITYIDRQATHRKLIPKDHESLLAALHKFAKEKNVEVHAVKMEQLSMEEQFEISTKTDIMIGVHGNGLSHQMWMKPGSKVLEFFDTGGFMRDYQLLAEAMHHTHYVIWNNTIHNKWREEKKTLMTKNFNNVALHAPFVIGLLDKLVKEIRAK